VLVEPDTPIRDVSFPREGIGSVLAVEQEGDPIEVGTIGPDGLTGIPVLHSAESMPYRVFGWRRACGRRRKSSSTRAAG
jgi:hypothetical protein